MLLVMFDMIWTTCSREELAVRVGRIVAATIFNPFFLPTIFHFEFDTVFKSVLCQRQVEEFCVCFHFFELLEVTEVIGKVVIQFKQLHFSLLQNKKAKFDRFLMLYIGALLIELRTSYRSNNSTSYKSAVIGFMCLLTSQKARFCVPAPIRYWEYVRTIS